MLEEQYRVYWERGRSPPAAVETEAARGPKAAGDEPVPEPAGAAPGVFAGPGVLSGDQGLFSEERDSPGILRQAVLQNVEEGSFRIALTVSGRKGRNPLQKTR